MGPGGQLHHSRFISLSEPTTRPPATVANGTVNLISAVPGTLNVTAYAGQFSATGQLNVTVNATDLIMLLDGVDLRSVKRRPRYVRDPESLADFSGLAP